MSSLLEQEGLTVAKKKTERPYPRTIYVKRGRDDGRGELFLEATPDPKVLPTLVGKVRVAVYELVGYADVELEAKVEPVKT